MTVPKPPLSAEDHAALEDLCFRWDSAYVIKCNGEVWTASPLSDPTVILTAESAFHLREQIRTDYHAHGRANLRTPWEGSSL